MDNITGYHWIIYYTDHHILYWIISLIIPAQLSPFPSPKKAMAWVDDCRFALCSVSQLPCSEETARDYIDFSGAQVALSVPWRGNRVRDGTCVVPGKASFFLYL
jgi:hypothetical protein